MFGDRKTAVAETEFSPREQGLRAKELIGLAKSTIFTSPEFLSALGTLYGSRAARLNGELPNGIVDYEIEGFRRTISYRVRETRKGIVEELDLGKGPFYINGPQQGYAQAHAKFTTDYTGSVVDGDFGQTNTYYNPTREDPQNNTSEALIKAKGFIDNFAK